MGRDGAEPQRAAAQDQLRLEGREGDRRPVEARTHGRQDHLSTAQSLAERGRRHDPGDAGLRIARPRRAGPRPVAQALSVYRATLTVSFAGTVTALPAAPRPL